MDRRLQRDPGAGGRGVTITDTELVRGLAYMLLLILGGCATVAWWGVRIIVRNIAEFKDEVTREMRGFDRRVTRIEAHLRLPTPMPEGAIGYTGPERRAGDD